MFLDTKFRKSSLTPHLLHIFFLKQHKKHTRNRRSNFFKINIIYYSLPKSRKDIYIYIIEINYYRTRLCFHITPRNHKGDRIQTFLFGKLITLPQQQHQKNPRPREKTFVLVFNLIHFSFHTIVYIISVTIYIASHTHREVIFTHTKKRYPVKKIIHRNQIRIEEYTR